MKRKILILSLTVLGLIILMTACVKREFDGIRVANPDSYRLEVKQMNGTDTHVMELTEGDVLDIYFETERGKFRLEIIAPDGATIYTGNGTETTDFTVNILSSGEYSVRAEGRNAKGKIHIRRVARNVS